MTASESGAPSPLRPAQSGVFLVSRALPALRKAAQRTHCAWLEVSLHGVRDQAGFLAACARDLKFPPHFGANWDAFSDCINDFAWEAAGGYVIVIENVEPLARQAPQAWATALEILRGAADAWRVRNKTFIVMLDYAPAASAVERFPEPPLA
jgi:hypothetical protein